MTLSKPVASSSVIDPAVGLIMISPIQCRSRSKSHHPIGSAGDADGLRNLAARMGAALDVAAGRGEAFKAQNAFACFFLSSWQLRTRNGQCVISYK